MTSPSLAAMPGSRLSVTGFKQALRRSTERQMSGDALTSTTFMAWGPPAMAKSSAVYQLGDEMGFRVVPLRMSELRPEDMTGPPMPMADGTSRFHPFLQMAELTTEFTDKRRERHYAAQEAARVEHESKQDAAEADYDARQIRLQAEHEAGEDKKQSEWLKTEYRAYVEKETAKADFDQAKLLPFDAFAVTHESYARAPFSSTEVRSARVDAPAVVPFKEPEPVFLFLDEITNAAQEMQAPLHALVNEHRFGADNWTLRDNVVVVCAGNDGAAHGAFTQEQSMPMATRLVHLNVQVTPEEWVAWARQNGVAPEIISYVNQNQLEFYDFQALEEFGNRTDKTFANPRTWVLASEAIALSADDDELLAPLIEGAVGLRAASGVMGWLNTARKMPNLDDILRDPENTVVHSAASETDIMLITLETMIGSIMYHGREGGEEDDALGKRIDAFITYGLRMPEQAQQMLFALMMNLEGDVPERATRRTFRSKLFPKIRVVSGRMGAANAQFKEALGPDYKRKKGPLTTV